MSDYDDYPIDLPPALQGRNLDDVDPAEFDPPPLSREEGAERLAALTARIADGSVATLERGQLIARLHREHWSQDDIAAAAGISQAAVSKSLSATPGARALATNRSGPYLAGRMIGVADRLARDHWRRNLDSERTADKLTAGSLPVNEVTLGRLRRLLGKDLGRPYVPAVYREVLAEITDWLDEAGGVPPWPWTLAQQTDMTLGIYHQRAAITRALDAAAKTAAN